MRGCGSSWSFRVRAAKGWLAAATLVLWASSIVSGQGGMPDARTMSGIPLPVQDLPAGTVAVLLVNGDLSNPVKDHPVDLQVGAISRTVKTDGTGRAVFSDLPGGITLRALATVGQERVQSQTFTRPDSGGVRLVLVAGAPAAASHPPAVPGTVVIGGQSRLVVEMDDETLLVYYLFEVMNAGATPVAPAAPLVFGLPPGAHDATVLEGSSSQVTAAGPTVTVEGPFSPGATPVQVAYRLTVPGDRLDISQVFPVALAGATVLVQKAGAIRVASRQVSDLRDVTLDGRPFIAGRAAGVEAGGALAVELVGLPHRSAAPVYAAIVAALLILGLGAWGAFRTGENGASPRRELERRREQIFRELVRLESDAKAGPGDPDRVAGRRAALVAELERIYGELDTPAPAAGGEGLPA